MAELAVTEDELGLVTFCCTGVRVTSCLTRVQMAFTGHPANSLYLSVHPSQVIGTAMGVKNPCYT